MPESKFRWIMLIAATAAQAGAAYAMQGLGVMGAYLQRDSGLSAAQVGLLVTASGIATIGGLLVVGKLLDHRSERSVLGLGVVVMSGASAVAAMTHSFVGLLCCLIFVGIGYSSTQPGGSKSIAAWFDSRQRGLAMGIRQAGLPLGGALAAAFMPTIIARWGVSGALLSVAFMTALGGLLFVIVYRRPAVQAQDKLPIRVENAAQLDIVRHPGMRRAIGAGCALVATQYGLLMFLMLYIVDARHVTLETASHFLLIVQMAGVVGRIVLAALSDRVASNRYAVVVVCLACTSVGLLCLILLHETTPITALQVLCAWLGFFGFGWYGPWVAMVADIAPADRVGSALGVAMAFNQIFIVFAPPLLGVIRDVSGSFAILWTALAGLLLFALRAGRTDRVQKYK